MIFGEEQRLDRLGEDLGDLESEGQARVVAPVSIALTVWRDTSNLSARSAWLHRRTAPLARRFLNGLASS